MNVYLLWTTRNGQRQWDGPFATREAATAAAQQNLHCMSQGYRVTGGRRTRSRLAAAARKVLGAYQRLLDHDDLDGLRDALTELQEEL